MTARFRRHSEPRKTQKPERTQGPDGRLGGTLKGAMSQQEADRAASLLHDGTCVNIDATHVAHLAEPERFTEMLTGFFLT